MILRLYVPFQVYTESHITNLLIKQNLQKNGKRITNNLVVKALKNAYYIQNPDKNKPLIFYTDLVSQYTSNDLKYLCKEFNIIQSFINKGCLYDNACIKSFHFPIKKE